MQDLGSLLRLWFHECCRIFQDRLVSSEDRQWFEQKLRAKMADFGVKDKKILGKGPLLYGDFMIPNVENKVYEEIVDKQKVCAPFCWTDIAIALRSIATFTTFALFQLFYCLARQIYMFHEF